MPSVGRASGAFLDWYSKPIEVGEGVYQIRTVGARVTVLLGPEGVLLVDTGGRGSLPFLQRGLRTLGAGLDDLDLVVLTHYHPDHGGGLGRLMALCHAGVAIHESESQFVSGETPLAMPFRPRLLKGVARPVLASLYSGTAAVDLPLADGDALPWPEEVRIVHTPGHTPGSICLYLPGRKALISGDALQYRLGRLGRPAAAVTQDPTEAARSLGKLLSLDIEAIYFSHFSSFRGDPSAQIRRLVA